MSGMASRTPPPRPSDLLLGPIRDPDDRIVEAARSRAVARATRPGAAGSVPPCACRSGLTDPIPISGLRLRELLVLILLESGGPWSCAELAAAVEGEGFHIAGRAGKVVSDQLRYEVARGRARRISRGRYVVGTVTKQAKSRMKGRIRALRVTARTASACCDARDFDCRGHGV